MYDMTVMGMVIWSGEVVVGDRSTGVLCEGNRGRGGDEYV